MQNRLFWWTGSSLQVPSLYTFSPKHPCPCLVIASPMNHAATFCGDLGRQALKSELWISTLSHILGGTLVANRVCVWVELKFKGTLPRSVHWNSSLVTEGANTPGVSYASRLDPWLGFSRMNLKGSWKACTHDRIVIFNPLHTFLWKFLCSDKLISIYECKGTLPRSVHWNAWLVSEGADTPGV